MIPVILFCSLLSAAFSNAVKDFNLAVGRPVYQSSTFDHGWSADKAVDGNTDTNLRHNHCSHALDKGEDDGQWLVVDLGQQYPIHHVQLTNRGDCPQCANRMSRIIVGVTNSFSPTSNPPIRGTYSLCGQYPGEARSAQKIIVNCTNETSGQYVIAQQPENGPGLLTICELEVFDSGNVNLALNKPAYQSSQFGYWPAEKAVDGSTDPSIVNHRCSHAAALEDDPDQWLVVDLVNVTSIGRVVLYSRSDHLANSLDKFIVGVTNSFLPNQSEPVIRGKYSLCGQYPRRVQPGEKLTLNCDSSTPAARYVIIQQPADGRGTLSICEVEIFEREKIETDNETKANSSTFDKFTSSNEGSSGNSERTAIIILAILLGVAIIIIALLAAKVMKGTPLGTFIHLEETR